MSNERTPNTSMKDSMHETSADAPDNAQDLTVFVQSLLEQMQNRFNQMSDAIIGRIDEMGQRIDDLERSIGELMEQAGIEQEPEEEPTDVRK